jgi:flagellin-like protein
MKTLRKIRKSTKALSPVVASIILIAVTVAVSIAVAAWMGALTVGFMGTEELKITNCEFDDANNLIKLTVTNTGTTALTIDQVYVQNSMQSFELYDNAATLVDDNALPDNAQGYTVEISYSSISAGNNYQMKIVTAKGNYYTYVATAP